MALNRRGLLTGGIGAAAAGLLSGCGGKDLDDLLAQAATVPKSTARLTWWVSEIPSRRGAVVADLIIRAFERRHPQIRVSKINAMSTSDGNRSALTTQLAGGSPQPDVYQGDTTWPPQFGHAALALPVEQVLPDGFWDAYPDALRRSSTYLGKVYAVPFFTDSTYLYYRKDLLAKHGLRVPRTWEELLRTSRTVQQTGDVADGFLWQAGVTEALTANVTEFLADAGAPVLDERGRAALGGPEAERAFSLMAEFTSSGVTPSNVTTWAESDSQDAFVSGRGLFLRNWSYAWVNASTPEVSRVAGKVGVALRPGFEGTGRSGNSCAGGWSNFINPSSRHLGAAVAFARFCAGDEVQRLLAREAGVVPALTSALHSKEARAAGDATVLRAADLRLVDRPVQTPYYPQVSKALYTPANSVVGGDLSPAAGVRAAGDGLRAALEGKSQ
ncbi:extracellular solute-binding protein [Streptomyces albidoflavus]|uniref:extracellular solute-binding protein n=1 Tax=Streptomyces albidoflavus TaxID=1886 RepID=UPI000FF5BE62|nr:extracellular solute-binding protein [Streptomyces albidoflavus]RWZ73339.1 extracellular solute-binding protein [Streptomyces albidoflavus]